VVKIEFEFPDTGEGVTEGKFLEWKIEKGDEVEEDQVVGEAETDKAVVEIPAPADGEVESLKVAPGDQVEVGEVIMELDTGEEKDTQEESSEEIENEPEDEEAEEEVVESGEEEIDSEAKGSGGDVMALPKVRKLAEEKGVDLVELDEGERITEEDVREAANKEQKGSEKNAEEPEEAESYEAPDVAASPAVRRLAREKNVDISKVEGSGRGGRITRDDVLEAGRSGVSSGSGEKRTERKELSAIRKRSAERVEESRFTAPHVTHVEKADLTELKELRERVNDEIDAHLTYLPFIMEAARRALENHPKLNAEFDEEDSEIVLKHFYDFNIAVDTEKGLMIPKIEDVDRKSIEELAIEIADKAERAKDSELKPEELKHGSFSITNLGVIGGEEFTPIINYPQTSILGIGRISETAEVVDGEVEPRTTVKLSLSYDHRVIDGAEAARFMNDVVENLEKPEKMLVEM
jgi:pyruvate dehydrogenase E2 component (dihydrolipoamide acetyltransferase)